jgi:hypothetical protein
MEEQDHTQRANSVDGQDIEEAEERKPASGINYFTTRVVCTA